jgi:hypothetical protein
LYNLIPESEEGLDVLTYLSFMGTEAQKMWNIPNTQANKKADPNPTASPAAIVSGDCIR